MTRIQFAGQAGRYESTTDLSIIQLCPATMDTWDEDAEQCTGYNAIADNSETRIIRFVWNAQAVISVFDLFKIGIGPSSSHTVGPMVAARRFATLMTTLPAATNVARISVELFGSLALTGLGHGTDRAVIMGLCGEQPATIEPNLVEERFAEIVRNGRLSWLGLHPINFDMARDLIFNRTTFLPQHPNGLRFTAYDSAGESTVTKEYFSVGGGFVLADDEIQQLSDVPNVAATKHAEQPQPFEFESAEQLLQHCQASRLSISKIVLANESTLRTESEIAAGLDSIWDVMQQSVDIGCRTSGMLPGGLGIRRRAPEIFRKLTAAQGPNSTSDPLQSMDWVTLHALAVNEQNAAGGRVVTAPTNGAAGVIPAVISYYLKFVPHANREGVREFLLTAAAIGMLYKRNASLSAAEMGCQGEVGVACSMAAAGLAAVMGGTPNQIENAAEIGMEHNLGLTCDPIMGLVQVPCIERNTMGAVKAINAARLAVLYGDGHHRVSLDRVIETMRQTGVDMQSKYKETSLGGLAVNVINC